MKRFFSCLFSLVFMFCSFPTFQAQAEGYYRPKVSIVIPVYKVEPWIRECMDSLVNQTLEDIEIICVDDGSPDNSGAIVEEYAKNDSRVKVIHQKNQGVQAARNTGISNATGEYITFVDSDDYMQLDAYEVAYKSAKKDNVDILMYQSRWFYDGEDNHSMGNNDYSDAPVHKIDQYIVETIYNNVWNKLFKAELIKKDNVQFIKGIKPADDTCFAYMALGRANTMKIIPTKLYNYRIRPGSLANISDDEVFINSYKMLKLICDDWRSHGLLKDKKHLLLDLLVRWCAPYEIRFKYASEVLNSFGADIYNPEVINKCNGFIKSEIKKLENAAISSKCKVRSGIYTIESALDNNKVLDIPNSSNNDFANLHLWDKNGGNNQKFKIVHNTEGYYTIRALCSNKMLDVANAGQAAGTNIAQYRRNGSDAQKWYILPCGKGYYNIVSKCNGLPMDVENSRTHNGTNIRCWSNNNSNAQKFKFVR